MKNITIVTSGHPPTDERIFYKIGSSLKKHGFNVTIVCSNLEINTEKNGIVLSGFEGNELGKTVKISRLAEYISGSHPDLIICCEPLTIKAAYDYKQNRNKSTVIVSDITEWYPENVAFKFRGLKRIIQYVKLFLFNIYTANLADALIIGEITKKRRYDFIAPFRPKTIIGYYPVLEYFSSGPADNKPDQLTLGYAGVITFERGILNLLQAAEEAAQRHPDKKIRLKIAGRFQYADEEKLFRQKSAAVNSIKVEFCEWVEYTQIAEVMKDMDICFDLRRRNFIYRNSLPIKIFEYMACGKPVVYSDIMPIRKELDVQKFGFLVDPDNHEQVTEIIEKYIIDPQLIQKHALEARKAVEEKYSWERTEGKLLEFINRFV